MRSANAPTSAARTGTALGQRSVVPTKVLGRRRKFGRVAHASTSTVSALLLAGVERFGHAAACGIATLVIEPLTGVAHYRRDMYGTKMGLAPLAEPTPAESGSTMSQRSDDELMLLSRAGVAGAFDVLVVRHQARLRRVAARQVGGKALAADLAQNTFLEIYRARDRYQGQGAFRSYLYRVLLNQCRMTRRSASVAQRALDDSQPPRSGDDTELLQRERRREVERGLDGLSEKLRDVVVLRYCADLDYEEIAQTLGLPLGTVKRRLFDAMAKLRELLEDA
jgi:RNA polymerase sigma-70 factor, ECF subfamily